MNSDIVIRVIDWFVSICETQLGKRPWLMEKEGGKKNPKQLFLSALQKRWIWTQI